MHLTKSYTDYDLATLANTPSPKANPYPRVNPKELRVRMCLGSIRSQEVHKPPGSLWEGAQPIGGGFPSEN